MGANGELNHKAKKQFGQNFLTNPAIPKRIVENSGITGNHGAIEIGPGKGILTTEIAKVAEKTVAVEIDTDLLPYLEEKFADNDSVSIISGDIMNTDIKALIKENFPEGMPVSVCANIPYYITSPIILKLLDSGANFDTMTFMVQKEVASRLTAPKGTADYSSLTALCSYYGVVKKLFSVPAGCFTPKPNVDSAVIRFDMYKEKPVHPVNLDLFFDIIRSAFAFRRKTFVNCLASNGKFTKAEYAEILKFSGFSENVRGEELDIFDFCKIADEIEKRK